jgi:transposase-like protein
MSSPLDNQLTRVAPDGVRQQAIKLYFTTNLGVGAIAKEVRVSRETVYRWLRQHGVPLGRGPSNPLQKRPGGQPILASDDIAGVRQDLGILIAQLGRLERLLEAVVRPKQVV